MRRRAGVSLLVGIVAVELVEVGWLRMDSICEARKSCCCCSFVRLLICVFTKLQFVLCLCENSCRYEIERAGRCFVSLFV